MPVSGSPKIIVATPSQGINTFAWSPDASTAAYLTQSNSRTVLHLVSGGRDRVVSGDMAGLPITGCENPNSQCADTWEFQLSYSPDGSLISLVNTLSQPAFRVWTSKGTVLTSIDSQLHTMSTWSGNGLYFRDANGVEVWRDGEISPFLPGVAWIRPKASPAGGQIVYQVRDRAGWHHVFVVDTVSKQRRELKVARAEPAFLTSRFIWYEGERACTSADGCQPGYGSVSSGKTYIYDLRTGTETESVITAVLDVWPRAA